MHLKVNLNRSKAVNLKELIIKKNPKMQFNKRKNVRKE